MVEKWMSLHDAAAKLEVSLRTIQRRIRDGTLRCRRGVIGRREVLLNVTDGDTEGVQQALQTVQDQLALFRERAEATDRLAESLRQQASAADSAEGTPLAGSSGDRRLRGIRRLALAGWAVAAVLAVVAGGAVRYGVEAGRPEAIDRLREQVNRLVTESDVLRGQRDELQLLIRSSDRSLAGHDAAADAFPRRK